MGVSITDINGDTIYDSRDDEKQEPTSRDDFNGEISRDNDYGPKSEIDRGGYTPDRNSNYSGPDVEPRLEHVVPDSEQHRKDKGWHPGLGAPKFH